MIRKSILLALLVAGAASSALALDIPRGASQDSRVRFVNYQPYNITRIVGPAMAEAGYGSIINISSVVGVFGNIGQTNYAATKAGVIGMTKTGAKEFARKGANVRCNAIAPGYCMTDILKTVPQDLLDKFAKMTMLGRLGQPEEIADAALYLASSESSYVTGHVLEVNGGMRL